MSELNQFGGRDIREGVKVGPAHVECVGTRRTILQHRKHDAPIEVVTVRSKHDNVMVAEGVAMLLQPFRTTGSADTRRARSLLHEPFEDLGRYDLDVTDVIQLTPRQSTAIDSRPPANPSAPAKEQVHSMTLQAGRPPDLPPPWEGLGASHA